MMPDIYIAASITSALSLIILGGLLFLRAPREDRPLLAMLVLIMLPMNALAFHLIRMPVDGWLSAALGKQSGVYQCVRMLYAPLTEEPAKLWPFLIPWLHGRMKSRPAYRIAFAIGLGFGVGEAWTVANLLSKSPEFAKYPWYLLGGYMSERMMVCVMHSAFTAVALTLMFNQKRIVAGLLACIFLHFAGNFPIFLAGKNVWGLGPNTWRIILQLWVLLYFLAMGALIAYLVYGKQWFSKVIRGQVKCPECKAFYVHPIFGVNLLHKRYERCLHCKRWHLVSAFDEENTEANNSMQTTPNGAPDK